MRGEHCFEARGVRESPRRRDAADGARSLLDLGGIVRAVHSYHLILNR